MTESSLQPSFEQKASWNEFATAIMDLLDDLPQTIFTSDQVSNQIKYQRTFISMDKKNQAFVK